jgi:hypothetical protein
MGLARYRILGTAGTWTVELDGKSPNNYATKEAAFEAAVAAASLALRQGHEIILTAPGSDAGGTATGAKNEL